jgi:transcriptional regulator with XRE-family HTH domain
MLLNLKVTIAARGFRQIEFARKQDISSDLLSRIVRGWTVPSGALRRQIAKALNADENWLFSSDVQIPPRRKGKLKVIGVQV